LFTFSMAFRVCGQSAVVGRWWENLRAFSARRTLDTHLFHSPLQCPPTGKQTRSQRRKTEKKGKTEKTVRFPRGKSERSLRVTRVKISVLSKRKECADQHFARLVAACKRRRHERRHHNKSHSCRTHFLRIYVARVVAFGSDALSGTSVNSGTEKANKLTLFFH
jgi:hypothetical protein